MSVLAKKKRVFRNFFVYPKGFHRQKVSKNVISYIEKEIGIFSPCAKQIVSQARKQNQNLKRLSTNQTSAS